MTVKELLIVLEAAAPETEVLFASTWRPVVGAKLDRYLGAAVGQLVVVISSEYDIDAYSKVESRGG